MPQPLGLARGFDTLNPSTLSMVRQAHHFRVRRLTESIEVTLQLPASGRMSQLPQGLGLDLAHALAGDLEGVAHLFQSMRIAVVQAEPQAQNLRLPLLERTQHLGDLFLEENKSRGVGG